MRRYRAWMKIKLPPEILDQFKRAGKKGGKVGGASTSDKKRASAARNGALGGRPRKVVDKPKGG